MARSRFAKPEFFDDPVLARCSHPARLLFVACWQVADRCGVFEWDPARLRKYAFGYEDITSAQVETMLSELVSGGFLRVATFEGRAYALVVNLAKHQKFHVAEKPKYENVFKSATWLSTVQAPTQHPASTLLAPPEHRIGTVPESLSLETETETENGDGVIHEIAKPKRERKTPSAQSASPPGFGEVIAVWFEHYEKRYGQRPKWGAREGRQLKTLMADYTAEELCDLIRYFFAWRRPEVIKAGHSFAKGYTSFIAKLDELRADIAAPERRAEAAQAGDKERNDNRKAATLSQAERLAQRFTGTHNEQSTDDSSKIGTGAQGLLGPGEASCVDVRDLQPPTE
jgi:hypothetical protein